MSISPSQLKTLQTLFSQYARRFLTTAEGDARAVRLAWASEHAGRPVASFRELRAHEAAQLIDVLKQALGQAVTPPMRRPRDRQAAMAAGTHGRRNRVVKCELLAAPEDVERVHRLRQQIGMSEEQFAAWLRSRTSPLGWRAEPTLRTVADCNKVLWALRGILRRAG